ncbi:malonate decarboxylase subunit epsilon [Dyella sp.]|uniref:malonate decarboxylase subunit epsilon n=1 Tax=Dyella sp. TaxID=1869338 RepID=UPI002ED67BE5
MTLAILCSGQGAQHADMFALTGQVSAAQPWFAHAASLLGHDPRAWVAQASGEDLFSNRSAQLLCTVQALAAMALVSELLPQRRCIAGYSVGEMAAWGVARLLPAEVTLDLVAARAQAMDAARHGEQGMLFVRGLGRQRVEQLCLGREAAIAIVNPGDAWVIGGMRDALASIAAQARHLGAARVVPVHVNIASHTPLLAEASSAFAQVLRQASFAARLSHGVRLLSGIDGASVLDIDEGVDKLSRQLSHPIDWAACLEGCIEAGASAFLELGPGRALADMAVSAYPNLPARSLDDFHGVQGLATWLARVS